MGNMLYVVVVILIILWAVGLFFYGIGAIIHLLLVIAFVSFLVKIYSRKKTK